MRLTVASEYACLALLVVAGNEEGSWCKRAQISERYPIPTAYLEQLLRKLTLGGIVVSKRGADGGFRLARPGREVTIASVVRAIDGALAPVSSVSDHFYQPSPLEASVAFHSLFRRVRDAVAEILEHTTLEDMVEHERKSAAATSRGDRRRSRATIRRARS